MLELYERTGKLRGVAPHRWKRCKCSVSNSFREGGLLRGNTKDKRKRKQNWTRGAIRLQCRSETSERKAKKKPSPAGRASDSLVI